jgi:hypothetical protein
VKMIVKTQELERKDALWKLITRGIGTKNSIKRLEVFRASFFLS